VGKPDPGPKASGQDEAEEVGCGLVISGRDTPLLEMTNSLPKLGGKHGAVSNLNRTLEDRFQSF
jgi:hypothetical protein